MPKILILASAARSLLNFRGDFIRSLIDNGYQVFAAAPEMVPETAELLQKLGATPLPLKLARTGINPFRDLGTIWHIRRIIRKYEIDMLFPYTIKPVIYGSMAARTLNIPVVSMITGLGFTFGESNSRARMLQQVTQVLYKWGLSRNRVVIFQNRDDRDLFLQKGLIGPGRKTALVNGSGVNLDGYPFRKRESDGSRVVFVLVARLIREKGVDIFMEAAESLKQNYPGAEFHIIGQPDGSMSSISATVLQDYHDRGIIVYHGFQRNVPELLYDSDVFVLPTFYREGVPRSILEALSIGMPIITTDTPGCRETIVPNKNGILIPPKDQEALYEAMKSILDHPERIGPMGLASRKLAEEKFDVRLINKELIRLIGEA
ncbi:glycosyltransferase family 4 protein [Robiginitalea sp. SC105]|uniref:glycosyltransferase family 4 protein n=1 Tax=Robiginitalea sp. SC105 TaxID=2762332 RepID=UPI00163AD74A|nr:glycosyltransferase family 4 protein [Robiginitalea sp. SC105]MBC2840328.1 glycosyltransferase family 4 protein [Robiginitalea sp. SC105]